MSGARSAIFWTWCAGACGPRAKPGGFQFYEMNEADRCDDERARQVSPSESRPLGFSAEEAVRAIAGVGTVGIAWPPTNNASGALAARADHLLMSVALAEGAVVEVLTRPSRVSVCRYPSYLRVPLQLTLTDPQSLYRLEGEVVAFVSAPQEGGWFLGHRRANDKLTGTGSPELWAAIEADTGRSIDPAGAELYASVNVLAVALFARPDDQRGEWLITGRLRMPVY